MGYGGETREEYQERMLQEFAQAMASSRRAWKIGLWAVFLLTTVLTLSIGSCKGCSNVETPAGFEGYIRRGAVIGSTEFYGTQTGPTSTGLGWLLGGENIEFRWQTKDEDFSIMADNLTLTFGAHVVIRPKPGTVKAIVETWGGKDWYTRVIQQPFRNAVYEAVSGQKALEANDKRDLIADAVRTKFLVYLGDKPFEVQSIVIGNIALPPEVQTAQAQRVQKQTMLEQKQSELDIATKDAEIRVESAKGIAEAQKIINSTLTSAYLQHEAIEAQEKMAMSPNHTTIYIPSGANGIPLVKTVE